MENFDQQEQTPPRDMNATQGTSQLGSADSSTGSVGMAVISTVAARSNTDPEELDSLYSVVDPDALEALFQPGTTGTVSFRYHGYEVVVHSDGDLDVTRADERPK